MTEEIDLIHIRCYDQGQNDAIRYGFYDNPYPENSNEFKAYAEGFWDWYDGTDLEWIGVDD